MSKQEIRIVTKIIRELSDEEVEGIRQNTGYYVQLLADYAE